VILLVFAFLVGSVINLFVPPSYAVYGDEVIEDIGGDNALVATLKNCVEVGRSDIADGNFKTAQGQNLVWKNAKNISYVDIYGQKGYMIVWKDSSQNYNNLSGDGGVSYISDDVSSMDAKCFLVYFPEKNAVYGIILGTDNIRYSESDLLYNILDLDRSEFPTTYSTTSYDSSSSYGGGYSQYHTVVPDRHTLSRDDPGAYYDHYEYGDDYGIDDFLESQGFD
jgi:hypothetical protein